MKKRLIRSRRARYGWIAAVLTVLLIAAVVLANALLGTLARRYGWYGNMRAAGNYDVGEKTYSLLGAALRAADEARGGTTEVEIIFCDSPENLLKSSTVSYVYKTAISLAERDPTHLRVTCRNIWLDPDSVRGYMTTTVIDPETGIESEQAVSLRSTSVIIVCGSYHRVYSHNEFFVFEGGDASKVWAYSGERKLAAGILRAVAPSAPVACLTNNHGEAYYDYEILYLLDDAGYRIDYVDLTQSPIPAECNLLICFNPNKDIAVTSGVSTLSEPDLLDEFLSVPGRSFLVFLEDGTPALPNLEAYLEGWGVSTRYHKSGDTAYRYMVQDSSGSLTSDGYTIYGKPNREGHAGELLAGLSQDPVFKNATALAPAPNFLPNGDGSYTRGDRTMYTLYETGRGAVAWANGAAVDGSGAILMALSEQTLAGGVSRVGVVASVRFAAEEFLQSAVYGNSDLMLRLLGTFGGTTTPEGISIKPFQATTMSTVTTAQKLRWTILLAALPAAVVTAVAVPVLLRRKRS